MTINDTPKDLKLTCKECGADFIVTSGEVPFYAKKGLQIPARCKYCRVTRRAERLEHGEGGARRD